MPSKGCIVVKQGLEFAIPAILRLKFPPHCVIKYKVELKCQSSSQ